MGIWGCVTNLFVFWDKLDIEVFGSVERFF
jgi:hypothetical protein